MKAQEQVDPNAPDPTSAKSKARRKTAAKASTKEGKRSLNLRIDWSSYQKLNVHALMRDQTVSELVMEFAQSLKQFTVSEHQGKGEGQADRINGS